MLAGQVTVGVGFTTTVAVVVEPTQPLAIVVMVKVTVTGAIVILVKEPLMFPVPLAGIPVTDPVLFLVQLKLVPATGPVITIGVIVAPVQMVCDAGVATALGVG